MKIFGVLGSPVNDSNTHRAVKAILDARGLDRESFRRPAHTVAPGNACLACVKTNRCVIDDDGIDIQERAKRADALVVGGFTPYSGLDSRTKSLLERLYPLRHLHGFLAGKPAAAVVTSATPRNAAADLGGNAIRFFAMEEGMELVGPVVAEGNVPCARCSKRDECARSGIEWVHAPEVTGESVGIRRSGDQAAVVQQARELGRGIRGLLA